MTAIAEQVARMRALSISELSATPPLPKSAKVELDTACNLACRFCAVGRRARDFRQMPRERFVRIAHELRASGVERLGLFYMNEPFVNDWLPEAIRIAKQDCAFPYVFLTSNGVAATPDRVQGCLEAGLDSLKFAFNFSSRSQFSASTTAPDAAYDTIIGNIVAAVKARDELAERSGHRCHISVSSLEFDERQRDRMGSVLRSITGQVDEHYWLPLLGRLDLAPWDTAPDADIASDGLLHKAIPCWPLFAEAHVTADGELSACCLDPSQRFAMGNLLDTGLASAWDNERFKALRSAHLRGDVSATACAECIGFD